MVMNGGGGGGGGDLSWVQAMLADADEDASGEIDFSEFMGMMAKFEVIRVVRL